MTPPNHSETGPIERSGANERDYLLSRAEDHQQLADNAKEEGTRTIHLRLRRLYLDRADRIAIVQLD